MFSVIVSDRKSDMENRHAILPEQRKLFPSDYFSRNFSLMIISLNGKIFSPADNQVECLNNRFFAGQITEMAMDHQQWTHTYFRNILTRK